MWKAACFLVEHSVWDHGKWAFSSLKEHLMGIQGLNIAQPMAITTAPYLTCSILLTTLSHMHIFCHLCQHHSLLSFFILPPPLEILWPDQMIYQGFHLYFSFQLIWLLITIILITGVFVDHLSLARAQTLWERKPYFLYHLNSMLQKNDTLYVVLKYISIEWKTSWNFHMYDIYTHIS